MGFVILDLDANDMPPLSLDTNQAMTNPSLARLNWTVTLQTCQETPGQRRAACHQRYGTTMGLSDAPSRAPSRM